MTILLANSSIVTLAGMAGFQPVCGEAAGAGAGEALLELVNAQVMGALLRKEEGHLLVGVRRRFDLRAVAAACAPYQCYGGRQGRMATYTAQQMLWALLGQQVLGLSLRGLEAELRQNLLLRWFCGFALHEATPDHSTLGRFNNWLRRHAAHALFQATLAQIKQDFAGECSKAQIGDTFAMHSLAADTDRTLLLRDVCRRLLGCLERACPAAHAAVLAQMGDAGQGLLFGQRGEVRDGQMEGEERNERECRTARGAALCLALVRGQMAQHGIAAAAFATRWAGQEPARTGPAPADGPGESRQPRDAEQQQRRRLDTWLDALDKILADEFVFSAAEPAAAEPAAVVSSSDHLPSPAPLPPPANAHRRQGSRNSKDAPGRFRIATAKDLHATYRVHGKNTTLGYNIALLTTDSFVHAIQAFTGARADGDTAALLIAAQRRQSGFAPARLIFDRAAGAPKRFVDVHGASGGRTQLVAPLLRAGRSGSRFGPDDFHFVAQAGVTLLTCPQGLTTARAYRSGGADGWHYRFLAAECSAVPCSPPAAHNSAQGESATPGCHPRTTQRCPLWEKCRGGDAKPTSHRTVFINDHLYQQSQAIAYTATPAFRQEMRTRAHVERIIAALTRYNGARRAKSTGVLAADHQARMAAVGYNLKRWHVLMRQRQKGAGHDSS